METETKTQRYRILVLDDEVEIQQTLYRLLRKEYDVHIESDGRDALAYMEENAVDLVISDMRMPNMDGAEFLTHVKEKYPDTIRLLLTGFADMESTVRAINDAAIYSYVAKPWDNTDLKKLVSNALRHYQLEKDNKRLYEELQALNRSLEEKVKKRTQILELTLKKLGAINSRQRTMLKGMISTIYELVEHQTKDTTHHASRVAGLARLLAERLDVPEALSTSINIAALLHETGKIRRPTTSTEQIHPYDYVLFGEEVLSRFQPMKAAAKIVRHIYERVDGAGYPDRLKGNSIPLASNIICLIKEFDLKLSHETPPQTSEQALAWLESEKGAWFEAKYVDAFKALYQDLVNGKELESEFPIGLKELRSGMVLSQDLILENGARLLSEGCEITSHIIEKLNALSNENKTELKLFVHYPAIP